MKNSGTCWLAAALTIGGFALCAGAAAQTVGGGGGGSGNATSIQSKPVAATAPATNQVLTWNGSAWAPAGVATGSNAWSSILAPTANEAINHGNFLTTFTWGSATGAGADMLKLTDSSSNTGTGAVLHVTTALGSVAIPIKLDANGLGVELNASGVLVPIGGGHISADQLQGNSVSSAAPTSNQVLTWNGSAWAPAAAQGGGSSAFSALTGGTNTSAAMLVGSGASLGPAGTGTVNANQITGVGVSTGAPATNQVLTYNGTQWAPANAQSGGAPAFSSITTGTNTGAAMLVGAGASLGPTSSGSLSASALQGCVNPLAYGAKGDDTTDDTSAFQSAITALDTQGGGCLWVPANHTFLIDGGLVLPTHGGTPGTSVGNQYAVSIMGAGWSRTNNFTNSGNPNGGSVLDLRFSQMAAPAAPVVTPTTGTGTLAAGTYFVKVTYTDPAGETTASAETSVTLSATGEITVTAPTFAADDESGWNAYISATTGTETKQNSSAVGVGANYVQSAALSAGAALPGANTTKPPKIITLGYGMVNIENLALIDGGTDCAPFVMTTATRLFVANDFFRGTTNSNPGSSIFSCNDALILGGLSTTQPGIGTSQDPFQGYGTVVRDNYFDAIRQGVLAQTYANSIAIVANTWTPQSGAPDQSHGAIALVGASSASPDSGNYIAGNLIEDFAYPTSIYLENASNNDLIANAFWDNSSTTKQYVWCDSTDGHMNIVDGSANFSGAVTFYQSGSQCGLTDSRQAQSDTSTLPNGLNVGNIVFNGTSSFSGSPISIASNWQLRTLTETASYTLNLIDQIVLMNSATATTATLPAAVNESGTTHCVVQIGAGGVTVAAGTGDTVNGTASVSLASQYSHVCVVSDGIHEWFAFSQ